MKHRLLVGLLVATTLWFVLVDARLRIGSFNCQVLGQTKMSKPNIVDVIVQIIRRYDIIFIQEIRDVSGTVPYQLLDAVNKGSTVKYNVAVSPRLGRTSSKEEYAYYYRNGTTSGIRLLETYVFVDTKDIFERPPYLARFSLTNVAPVNELILIGIHVQPSAALSEILALQTVHANAVQRWKSDNAILFGDMNADCSYLTSSQKAQLAPMYTAYNWLIPDGTNTNLAASICTYDRILVGGTALKSAIFPGSAKVFYFDSTYKLDANTAKEVSDHYPVEFELKDRTAKLVDLLAALDLQPTEP